MHKHNLAPRLLGESGRMADTSPILIVGAGTMGLAMACETGSPRRAGPGTPLQHTNKQSGINPHCRACSLHARTLEIFHDFGIVDEILAQGHKVLGMSQYANGERFMHSSGDEIDSPYPYTVNLSSGKTESALESLLRSYNVEVARENELVAISGRPDTVSVTIRRGNGSEEVVETPWLIGCDGAHSRVRHLNHIHFPGKGRPASVLPCRCAHGKHACPRRNTFLHARPWTALLLPAPEWALVICS